MAFPDELLVDGESVTRNLRPHWSSVVPPIVWLAISVGVTVVLAATSAVDVEVLALVGFVTVVLGLVVVGRFLEWRSSRYTITNHRVILRTGVIARDSRDVPLHQIQDIHLRQGMIARMAGAGNLGLQSAAARGFVYLRWVPGAQEVRRTVHQLTRQPLHREPA